MLHHLLYHLVKKCFISLTSAAQHSIPIAQAFATGINHYFHNLIINPVAQWGLKKFL